MEEAMNQLAELLGALTRVTAHLADKAVHGDHVERERARRALVTNSQTAATMARYVASPPSFHWRLVRVPLFEATGCEEWTIHT